MGQDVHLFLGEQVGKHGREGNPHQGVIEGDAGEEHRVEDPAGEFDRCDAGEEREEAKADIARAAGEEPFSLELLGLCTDICVVSNALLLKARFPEAPIAVRADCCAGVTPQLHAAALATMQSCQIDVI